MKVEDTLDRILHRPLARLVVAILAPLPVTGNQVTLARVLLGWLGCAVLFVAFFVGEVGPWYLWPLAAVLFFISMVLDCADGQLVRLRGEGSRLGRILDGAGDILVILPAYVIIPFGILHLYGVIWFLVAAVAGLSMWGHCLIFDRIKLLSRQEVEDESVASIQAERVARRGAPLRERALLVAYLVYLKVQDLVARGLVRRRADDAPPELPDMRLAGFLGLGTHVAVLYLAIGLMAVDPVILLAVQVLFAGVLNLLAVVVLFPVGRLVPDRAPSRRRLKARKARARAFPWLRE